MAEFDKEMQELKKEVVEARNLIIKTDNLLKNLHADLKLVAKKQEAFEKRSWLTSATVYILFVALSSLGAYMFARSEIRTTSDELKQARTDREGSLAALAKAQSVEVEARAESKGAFDLFQRLSSGEDSKRNAAIDEVATLQPKTLTELERAALKDKAQSLRQSAADDALENGRASFNRRDFKEAAQDLERHVTLAPDKPQDVAFLLLGQAHHALRNWKEAVPALERFLKESPASKNADYITMILAESLSEAGERERAIAVYRAGADKYYSSQYSPWMRARARKLEQIGREPPPPPAMAPAPGIPGSLPQ